MITPLKCDYLLSCRRPIGESKDFAVTRVRFVSDAPFAKKMNISVSVLFASDDCLQNVFPANILMALLGFRAVGNVTRF
jgi:hypothetical protein